ncbi:hypothetical protein [Mesorhizobium sp. B4-1-4]|uniref:hypothetical protein n=1 Tax=Mesorhizobium sp. B4-1-4 TaxID=2589888 RepID=UPI0011268AD9|nr:hypothetical protein [Mesorhizobium sp. B4-1-4]UCI30946.1 hypothetical protein FJW03_24675 [Mesorhizobium sp. B4-1-4]
MSADWDHDDLARLLGLEHAFCALALISASNFAYLAETTPSAAVKQFREAIEGSVYDTGQASKETKAAMKRHLKRMFDHIAGMAKHADLGPVGSKWVSGLTKESGTNLLQRFQGRNPHA